jgi:hypothetical protein
MSDTHVAERTRDTEADPSGPGSPRWALISTLTRLPPWLGSVTGFIVTLRPAWWLLRGYLLAWALWSMILAGGVGIRPQSSGEYFLALVAVVVSVQVGRVRCWQKAIMRPLLVVTNLIAVMVLVMIWGSGGRYNVAGDYTPAPGVSVDGAPVGNIYPYDAAGRRITGVRLFTQDGRPLDAESFVDINGDLTVGLDGSGNPRAVVRDSSGASLLNVYPRAAAGSDPWTVPDSVDPRRSPGTWAPPAAIFPLVAASQTWPG